MPANSGTMPFGQPFQQHGPSKPKRCGQGPMGTMVSECGKLAIGWAPAGDGTIDPPWSRSLWSECTASCGDTGVQVRDRTCSIPNRCEGEPSQSQSCNRTRQCFDLPPPTPLLLFSACHTSSSTEPQWSEWVSFQLANLSICFCLAQFAFALLPRQCP